MHKLSDRGDLKEKLTALLEQAKTGDRSSLRTLKKLLEQDGGLHSLLIHLLTHLEYQEDEAKHHWQAIEEHHEELSKKLGRDTGLQVAILDYFFNLHPRLHNPKVIEIARFLATEREAFTDSLTGLYNRLYFNNSLRRETKRAHRYGLTFSLVMLDLDDFKRINDRFGHLVGDDALSACSVVIRESVREIDVPCRYGGEEFAIILPETSRSGAYIVSERIRADIETLFQDTKVRGNRLDLSISGGVAIFPIDSSSEDGLLAMADRALYRSKQEGKNQITLHADEKRRSPRFEAVRTLTFRSPVVSGVGELTSQTKNLSRNGALLESGVPLTIGTELELQIKIQKPSQKYRLKGKVVRREEFEDGDTKRYDIGIAFLAEDEDELRLLEDLTEELHGLSQVS